MRIEVAGLLRSAVGTSEPFKQTVARLSPTELKDFSKLAISGELTRLDEGILVAGQVASTVKLTCSRCLIRFDHRLNEDFSEVYATQPSEDQFELKGTAIDLIPLLRNILLLALPARPLHAPTCKGLCTVCGQDLNQKPHRHRQSKAETPFDALKSQASFPRKRESASSRARSSGQARG